MQNVFFIVALYKGMEGVSSLNKTPMANKPMNYRLTIVAIVTPIFYMITAYRHLLVYHAPKYKQVPAAASTRFSFYYFPFDLLGTFQKNPFFGLQGLMLGIDKHVSSIESS